MLGQTLSPGLAELLDRSAEKDDELEPEPFCPDCTHCIYGVICEYD